MASVQRMAQSHLAVTSHSLQALQRVFKKYNFLPNEDPYRQKTQPMCYTGTTRVCLQNFAAVRHVVPEFIT